MFKYFVLILWGSAEWTLIYKKIIQKGKEKTTVV